MPETVARFCPGCGTELREGHRFCPQCGASRSAFGAPGDPVGQHAERQPKDDVALLSRIMITSLAGVFLTFATQVLGVWACGPNACRENPLPTGALLAATSLVISLLLVGDRVVPRPVLRLAPLTLAGLGLGGGILTALWVGVLYGQEFGGGANPWFGTPMAGAADAFVYSFPARQVVLWEGTAGAALFELALISVGLIVFTVCVAVADMRLFRLRQTLGQVLRPNSSTRSFVKYTFSLSSLVLAVLSIFAMSSVPAIANDAAKTRAAQKVAQLLVERKTALATADNVYAASAQSLDDLHALAASTASAYATFNFGIAGISFPESMRSDVSQLIASDGRLIGAAQQMTQATFVTRGQLAQSYAQSMSEQQAAELILIRDLQVGSSR